jgi:hypothetical protein
LHSAILKHGFNDSSRNQSLDDYLDVHPVRGSRFIKYQTRLIVPVVQSSKNSAYPEHGVLVNGLSTRISSEDLAYIRDIFQEEIKHSIVSLLNIIPNMIPSFVVALLAIATDARPQNSPAAAPSLPVSGENGKMGGIFGMGDLSFKDVLMGTPNSKSGGTGIVFITPVFTPG